LESILLSHWLTVGICVILSIFLPLPHVTLKSIIALAILGVVQMGFSAILFSIAIKHVSAIQANLIAVIEPVFNPVWVFFVLGESPGIHTLIGGGIILFAVIIASVVSARRKEGVMGPEGLSTSVKVSKKSPIKKALCQ
jgi:drug/metabolite transporter (DMT)-like permease